MSSIKESIGKLNQAKVVEKTMQELESVANKESGKASKVERKNIKQLFANYDEEYTCTSLLMSE